MEFAVAAPARPESSAGSPASGVPSARPPRAVLVAFGALIAAGVALRFAAGSDLWLDEALSVNVARLPLSQLRTALLHDGAPPLSYVLLHGWIAIFGASTTAVRAFSGVVGTIAIGVSYLAARSVVADARAELVGGATAVVVATSPFAIRYSTEARMYELTILLGFLAVLVGRAAWRQPSAGRLAEVAIVTTALLSTQYWAFFLLAVAVGGLLAVGIGGPADRRRRGWLLLGAVVAGFVLFLPWWPTFVDQLAHTGTPWDTPASVLGSARRAVLAFGGAHTVRWVVTGLGVGLVVAALARRRAAGRVGAVVAGTSAVAIAVVALGIAGAVVTGTGFQERYVAVAFPFAALAVGAASRAVAPRIGVGVLGALAVVGLVGGWQDVRAPRTAASGVAAELRAGMRRTDVVAYCPDQLAPPTARLLPGSVDQVTFPDLGDPRFVDWTDYAARNHRASPDRFAAALLARAGAGRVFVVWSGGYRTLGTKCESVVNALARHRPDPVALDPVDGPDGEQVGIRRFDP